MAAKLSYHGQCPCPETRAPITSCCRQCASNALSLIQPFFDNQYDFFNRERVVMHSGVTRPILVGAIKLIVLLSLATTAFAQIPLPQQTPVSAATPALQRPSQIPEPTSQDTTRPLYGLQAILDATLDRKTL